MTGVEVTSNAGADATYALGETIEVTVRFSETVDVTGAPGLAIDMDPAHWGEKRAAYARGSGTAALVFAHEVVEPNLSRRGIAVLSNTLALNGGAIRSAASQADADLTHVGLAHDATHKVDWRLSTDTTAPRLVRGEVDGATMRLVFSEALDPAWTGGRFMVDLSTQRLWSNFDATGSVTVEGNVVTVGMGAGNPRAEAGRLEGNQVLYIRRADGAGGALRDLAGNLVAAPHVLPIGDGVEWRYVRMALANVTGPEAPAVTGVEVTSDAGDDATYALGEAIEVTVRFSEAVDVTGTPGLAIDMDPASWGRKRAAYARGSGTAALVFAHEVVEPNLSRRGIAVLSNTLALNGGAIRSASSQAEASLTHVGLAHDAAHKVDWRLSPDSAAPADTTAPQLLRGEVDGATMTLWFSEVLDPASTGGRFLVDLAQETPTVGFHAAGPVTVEGAVVTVGLGAGNPRAQAGRLAGNRVLYIRRADGGGGALRDLAGNPVAAPHVMPYGGVEAWRGSEEWRYVRIALDNVTEPPPDTTPPRLSRTVVDGAKLTLAFDEAIDDDAPLTNGAFTVKKTPPGGAEETVGLSGSPAVEGAAVTLTLAKAVRGADTSVKVSYRKSASGAGDRLKDEAGNEVVGFNDEPVTNVAGDTTPPRLVWGEVDGGTVTLYFSEPLDENSVGGHFRANLHVEEGWWRDFTTTGDMKIKGNAVTIGLVPPRPEKWAPATRAKAGLGDNRGFYFIVDPGASRLQDLAGNPVRTPGRYGQWPSTRTIDLDNLTGVAPSPPSVSNVVFTSDAGDDATYGLGDTIRVRLHFRRAVNVTGTPRVQIDLGPGTGDERWADYAGGSGTKTLEFAYTVAQGDASSAGVAVLADTLALNGGTIRSAATGENANLAHVGRDHDRSHRVDSKPHVTGVAFSSDADDDATYKLGETVRVTVTFSEAVAVTGAPRLKVDLGSGAGDKRWADYAGGSGTPMLEFAYTVVERDFSTQGVAVLENTLALNGGTIKSTTAAGENATLAHAGLDHDPAHRVDARSPTLSAARVDGARLTLIFNEPLGAAASLANGAFTVKKTPQAGTEQNVRLSGSPAIGGATVTLTLTNAVLETDTNMKVSYTRPASGTGDRLRDAAGNEVASFSNQPVANSTDTTPPRLSGARVNGATLTLTFNEALGAAASLANGAFTVKKTPQAGTEQNVSLSGSPAIGGATVTLTLTNAVLETDTDVKVSYTRPTTGTGNRLGDAAGNEVESFTGQLVVPDTTPPRLVRGEIADGTVTLYFSEALDEDSVGGEFLVDVLVGDRRDRVRGAGRVKIDGSTVTFETLASNAVTWLWYIRPTDGTAGLRDLVGNEVRSLGPVTLNSRPAPLSVTGVAFSVADARANEGAGASVAFEVSLSRAAAGAVTVDYATADGTAEAGSDYTATSGTLTFAAGETSKTVNVPVLDDAVDEGEETFTFWLSNPTGARIADGEATGTIANDDPLQKMWLSRFGRTVAGHVTEAVSERLANPLAGAELSVGGQRVDLAETGDEAWFGQTLTSLARVLGAQNSPEPEGGWPGTGLRVRGSPVTSGAPARAISGRGLLPGSAFHFAREGDGPGPGFAAWGRVIVGGFDGEAPADDGKVRIDGEVTTGILGADAEWNRLLAGVAVSVSEGEGHFDQPGVDKGTIESTMTAVSPYARLMLNERVSAWGLAGWGTGDMTIMQDARAATDTGPARERTVTRTDLEMRLAALGGRGALLEAEGTGGMDLALRADAFWVETEAEAVSNEGNTTADASRVRLALEGSRAFETGGGVLTPGLELGLRHDGGDAETGTGVELGGRVSWADAGTGLGMEARLRTLVAHEDSDYREWGASGAVRLDPGASGRGLSFSLAPTWGAASSGVERLWSARDARGLAPGAGFEPERRLEGELGYGLALSGGRLTGTPNAGFALSDRAREYRIGWRLVRARRGASGLEVDLNATRREPVNDNGAGPEHGMVLRGALRW